MLCNKLYSKHNFYSGEGINGGYHSNRYNLAACTCTKVQALSLLYGVWGSAPINLAWFPPLVYILYYIFIYQYVICVNMVYRVYSLLLYVANTQQYTVVNLLYRKKTVILLHTFFSSII